MASLALVTTVCPDRVGLISGITGQLFGLGINLRDATFAVMGTGAEFSAVCELPPTLSVEEVRTGLAAVPELEGARIEVTPFRFDPNPGPAARITHRVLVSGGDQPGLIARLSEIFTQFQANIVRMDAQTTPGHGEGRAGGLYTVRFSVSIPAERTEVCLSAVANTAEALGLACALEGV